MVTWKRPRLLDQSTSRISVDSGRGESLRARALSLDFFRGAIVSREEDLQDCCFIGAEMPLYDCLMLMKSRVDKGHLKDLIRKVAAHVNSKNGVLTDIKSFGSVQLGYGIKKLDGRHFQGQLMQMTMMVPPSFPKELQYLSKEDRLLRWLVVKHRGVKYGIEFLNEEEGRGSLRFSTGGLSLQDEDEDEDDDEDDEADDDYGEEEESNPV